MPSDIWLPMLFFLYPTFQCFSGKFFQNYSQMKQVFEMLLTAHFTFLSTVMFWISAVVRVSCVIPLGIHPLSTFTSDSQTKSEDILLLLLGRK